MRSLLTMLLLLVGITGISQVDKPEKQVLIDAKIVATARAGVSFPLGDLSDIYGIGINFGAAVNFKTTDNFYPGVSADDQLLFGKKIQGTNEHYESFNQLRLLVAPIIATNGKINLIVVPEVGISLNSIGGQTETKFTYGVKAGVPIFGEVPILAGIFRNGDNTFASVSLLIFITPRIVKSD
jgi:type II secretory pathway component GspD/PulD (secretin)